MKKLLLACKDMFVPSERNGNIPRLLSATGISAYLMVAFFLLLMPRYLRVTDLASLVQPFNFTKEQVVALVNNARAMSGIAALAANRMLEETAAMKAEDMLARQYFAHAAPDGALPWDFLKRTGYKYLAAGENLASDFTRPEDAHAAFLASPTHRANILNPIYTEIGVAVAQGNLNGHPNILVVQYFGKPRAAAAAPSAPPVASAPASPAAVAPPLPSSSPPPPAPSPRPTSSGPTGAAGAATAVTAGIRITPGAGTLVLGAAEGAPKSRIEATKDALGAAAARVPQQVKIKILALIIMGTLLVAAAFLANRTGAIPLRVAARTLAILLLFGYIAAAGGAERRKAQITPTSFATVSVIEQ